MKTKKIYFVLLTCCLSFLFVSCESELDGGGTGGGGLQVPNSSHKSEIVQQEGVVPDATDSADSQ